MTKRLTISAYRKFFLAMIFIAGLLLLQGYYTIGLAQTQTQTFTSNGTYIVPSGVTQIKVECIGGGGAGGYGQGNIGAGGGGAGGSYASSVLTVVPGNSYTVTVGGQTQINLGNSNKNDGNPSWFGSSSTIYASGGSGGTGTKASVGAGGSGAAGTNIGTVKFEGGNGEDGNITPGTRGGAGGGAAGPTGTGGNGSAGAGGTGISPNGGNGANGVADGTDGIDGNNYGGGGSGGKSNASSKRRGGDGARGLVTVTYLLPITGILTLCAGSTTTMINSATGGTWSSGSTSIATVNSSTGVVTGVSAGNAVITYTLGSGVSGANLTVTATVTVFATPSAPTIGTITQPSCSLATGSVILTGLPSSGTWTLTRSPGGVTTSGTGTSSTISSLAAGTYTYTISNASGCPSSSSANVVINAQPATPSIPLIGLITQPTCSLATGSVVLSGLPASGSWTITRTPGGNTNTGSGTSTTITGLTANTYTFSVTNAAGCSSFASSNVVINAQPPTPSAPSIGTITHPTCTVATGSVILSGLPSGTWMINPGNITGSTTSSTISNLSAGTYNYTVTNSAGCTSVATGNIVINTQPASPSIPVQLIDCTLGFNNAVITVSSPTGGGLHYSLDGGAYQSGTSFSGVANGTHSITVNNSSGCTTQGANFDVSCGCVNSPTVTLSSFSGNTCGTTPITVSGNTFINATNVTITTNGAGTISPSSAASSPFSFTYTPVAADAGNVITITVTSNNPLGSPCSADFDTYALTVNPLPAAPTVGTITQPTCAVATGSVNLTGLPSIGSWTISQSPGGAVYTGTGTSKLISGLLPGTYTFIVSNAKGCASSSSGNATISALPTAPSAPTASVTIQPNCSTATGTIVVSSPAQGSGYEYSIGGAYQASATFAGVNSGSQSVVVRRTSDNTCISAGTTVTVNAQPNPPSAPSASVTVQPTCAVALGTIVVSSPAAGTGFTYSIDGTNYQAGTTFTGVSAGIKNVTVRSTSDNSCVSPITNVTVMSQPSPPAAPVIFYNAQPDCFTGIGALTITSPTGSVTYSLNGTNYQAGSYFGNLSPGAYNATAKSTIDGTCISTSTGVTITTQPLTPSAPIVSIIQPTCAVTTGTITVTSPTGTGYTYALTGFVPNTKTTTNSTGIFSGLSPDTYLLIISETTSGTTCSTNGTYVTVNAVPTAPAAPTASVTVQPTCSLPTGTIVVSSPAQGTGYEYSIGGAYQASATFAGVTSGTKTVTVRSTADNTCISNGTNVTVNAQPATPAAPTAVTPAATSVCTGSSINLNATSSGNTIYWYTVATGGTNIGTSASGVNFSVSPSTYTTYYAESRTPSGCISTTRSATGLITINPFPSAAGTITGSATVCQGATAVSYSVSAITNATGYTWSYTGTGATITGTTNSVTITFAANATSGNLNVTGTNGCGSGTISAAYPIAVSLLPLSAGTITGSATVCQGQANVSYTVPSITNATSYTWAYSGTGATITGTTNSVTITFATNASAGNLTVRGTNACGNGTVSANYAIAVNPLPGAASTITGNATVCQGQSAVAYTVAATTNTTSYTWAYSGTGATITGTTNSVTVTFDTNSTSGNLTVRGTNACGNGTVSANFAITVNPLPIAAGTITGFSTVCQGQSAVSYSVPAITNATGYVWSLPTGATIANGSNTSIITVNYSTTAVSGNVTVYGTNSCGSGTISANYAVTVNPLPLAAGVITGTPTVCQGQG